MMQLTSQHTIRCIVPIAVISAYVCVVASSTPGSGGRFYLLLEQEGDGVDGITAKGA